jgi:hypothetical protein
VVEHTSARKLITQLSASRPRVNLLQFRREVTISGGEGSLTRRIESLKSFSSNTPLWSLYSVVTSDIFPCDRQFEHRSRRDHISIGSKPALP